MKSRKLMHVLAIVFAVLAISLQLAAQEMHTKHHHYKLIDLSLGGPTGVIFGLTGPLNNGGMASSCADTSVLDSNYPKINPYFGSDPYIQHTFLWRDLVLVDLGTLPGGTSSCEQWISDTGLIVGGATNGQNDPLLGVPEVHAALWIGTDVLDLGTLGGNESVAFGTNNYGEVVGGALNTIPDLYAASVGMPTGGATQAHAFLWKDGVMHDLGTLGTGTDSIAFMVNERGQVAGQSFTNNTVNPTTGLPTMDPFLWENGKMIDLGTLGGVFGEQYDLNNRGQVVGWSDLPGDQTAHPFLWDGRTMKDLDTLGGTFGWAWWLNDSGDVVGFATTDGDQALDAFLWRRGVMTDLKTLEGDSGSVAEGINASGQVVGQSAPSQGNGHAFLWENNGPIVNLQNLVLPGSDVTATEATFINDRGEIAGNGVVPDGDQHAILLVPCDDDHPGIEGCDYGLVDATTAAQVRSTHVAQPPTGTNENHDRPMGWRERLDGRLAHRLFRRAPNEN
jgi:probable HAF family extracellular repeat protein